MITICKNCKKGITFEEPYYCSVRCRVAAHRRRHGMIKKYLAEDFGKDVFKNRMPGKIKNK